MASGGEVEEVTLAEDEYERGEEMSISDLIDDHFPYFLLYGMTYEQYYNEDVELVVAYRKAYELRKEVEFNEKNQDAWLNGVYVFKALECQTEVLSKTIQGLASKNVEKEVKAKYPTKPLDFNAKEEVKDKNALSEEEIEKGRKDLIKMLSTMQDDFNRNKK